MSSTPLAPEPSAVASTAEPDPGNVPDRRVRLGEKFAYALGDVGSNVVFVPITAFLLFYLTNVAGVGAAIAGTILLVGQLLNGVTDLIVGALIDKTNTRWGKARPWILFTSIPMAISFVLAFSIPEGLDETGKVVWALIFYTLVIAVFFTASNVAYSALMSVMTPSPKTRVTLSTFRFMASLLTGLGVGLSTLPLVSAFGDGQQAWTNVALIFGFVSAASMVVVFLGTRERVKAPAPEKGSTVPLRQQLRDLFRNKYFYLAALLFVVFYLLQGITTAVGVYYATDVLGDASIYGLMTLAQSAPMLIGLPFMPLLIGRIGKRNAFLIGVVILLVGTLIPLLGTHDATLAVVSLVIRGVGMVPFVAGLFAIVTDVVDYGEWRTGVRTDGLIFSGVVFGQKVGGGLASAAAGWVLALGGYAAGAAAQSASAIDSIVALFVYIPLGLVVAAGVIVYFFKIERYQPQIQAFLAERDTAPAASVQN